MLDLYVAQGALYQFSYCKCFILKSLPNQVIAFIIIQIILIPIGGGIITYNQTLPSLSPVTRQQLTGLDNYN